MQDTVRHASSWFLRKFSSRFNAFSHLPLMVGVMAFIGILAFVSGRGWWMSRAAAGTVTGTVFQDYNANGVRDSNKIINNSGSGSISVAVDRGVSGVTVTAYSSAG